MNANILVVNKDGENRPRFVNYKNYIREKAGEDYTFSVLPEDVLLTEVEINSPDVCLHPVYCIAGEDAHIIDKGEKYYVTMRDRRTGETIRVDIYDVLEAFNVTCSAMAHALKKFLLPGQRGAKGYDKDCDEGINSVEQSKLLQKYRK